MNINLIPKNILIFGDQDFRGDCPTETAEQISFFSWLKSHKPELHAIAIHVRNEGKKTARQGHQHKLEGLNVGASDIIIPCFPTLVIELKRRDRTKSKISKEQIKYLHNCEKAGAMACLALGCAGAIEAVKKWCLEYEPLNK